MGIVLIGSLLVVFFNLVADVVYGFVDPRVRFD
jgi:ABC-type dipeptide/oligopeptide/nickel transport system permease component